MTLDDFDAISEMDGKDFQEEGYLREVNRRFFHPHGLALYIVKRGEEWGYGVKDFRDNDEGVAFGPGVLAGADYWEFEKRQAPRMIRRNERLGFVIQPPNG